MLAAAVLAAVLVLIMDKKDSGIADVGYGHLGARYVQAAHRERAPRGVAAAAADVFVHATEGLEAAATNGGGARIGADDCAEVVEDPSRAHLGDLAPAMSVSHKEKPKLLAANLSSPHAMSVLAF